LMPRPDPLVVSHGAAFAEHPDPLKISDNLDTAADHARVHGWPVAAPRKVPCDWAPAAGGARADSRPLCHRVVPHATL
jgi:hypothetical protein